MKTAMPLILPLPYVVDDGLFDGPVNALGALDWDAMIQMCTSIENWLQADEQNVAIVHCLTGKGRTSTVLAALLCWMGWDVGQANETFQNITTMQVWMGR